MASIQRVKSEFPPKHFSLRIESFSKVARACTEAYAMKIYDTVVFSAEGRSWRLNLYPNGNTDGNGKDHISLYLAIDDLASDEDVHVEFKFFVLDQKHKDYLTIFDNETLKRFHQMKKEWGYDQLMSLDHFKSPNNGYLVNDTCEFGVEVFVVASSTEKRHTLTVIKPPLVPFRRSFKGFSKMENGVQYARPSISFAGKTWKILLYPKGLKDGQGNSLSLFLELADAAKHRPGEQVWAEYKMRVINQLRDEHKEITYRRWFSGANNRNWGSTKFLSLDDATKGYVKNDALIVEVVFVDVSVTNIFTC